MSDWENDSDNAKPSVPKLTANSKWEGEDEEDKVVSDWDQPSDDEAPKPVSNAAPPRKKATLKQKLAEKEAIRQQRIANGEEVEEFLDEREKRLWERRREIETDLANAGDLLGSTTISDITISSNPPGSSHKTLESGPSSTANFDDSLLGENPRTKEEFEAFSRKVYNMIIRPHINNPLYAGFIETHVRQLCEPLKDSEIRKAASGLTTLASMKQQEAKDKTSGKKKPKVGVAVGGVKGPVKHDTTYYDEALDDFGNDPDDFM